MKKLIAITCLVLNVTFSLAQSEKAFINTGALSRTEFGNDGKWYTDNIPFFECSDKKIQEVYYYRWKLYKAHIKNLGEKGYIITEFLNAMSWDRKPYNSLNDATGFHIYEGRWLKDKKYIHDYINYLYEYGGNDRHFSEAIADAVYANYLVNPDKEFIAALLPSMIKIYDAWKDHFDSAKGLYYIEPLLDATEYTISSIDASGGRDGFTGGDAFRPSINSYMYANAVAISKIALLENDTVTASKFSGYAAALKNAVQDSLWNTKFQHFTDRYKVSNQYVKYWDFIRGRELVGYLPWTYNLPDDKQEYGNAWRHLLSGDELLGKYGLRTNEPSYQYYMKQYRYDKMSGGRECQWNGRSWPFQTSQALLGMANLLNNYRHHDISSGDYFNVLKLYTMQHFTGDGGMNIFEDYDPDKGGAIVDLNQRSEHYNHSEYNDLIITGFCGLRPQSDNSIVVNPLINADSIKYFCLQNVDYHGHSVTVVYDKTGKRYGFGKGLTIFIDRKAAAHSLTLRKLHITLPEAIVKKVSPAPVDLAINLTRRGFPQATASYTDSTVKVSMANDGRIWFFNDVVNYWTPRGSGNPSDWYQLSFEKPVALNRINMYFYADGKVFAEPSKYYIEYWDGSQWVLVKQKYKTPPMPNGKTSIIVGHVSTDKLRVTFEKPQNKNVALAELELF